MHVCHINLAGGYRGGERQTELLIRQLADRGVVQALIAKEDSELGDRLADVSGLTVKRIRKPFLLRWRHLEGDVVHAHENKGAHLAHLGRKFGGSPYILTRRIAKVPSDSRFTHDMYRRASCVVGVARTITDMAERYEPGCRTEVIYSVISELPVNQANVDALRARWSGKRVIINVAALSNYQKGQCHLIEAARQLSEKYDDLQFVLCGSGPDEQVLKEQASSMDNVHFAGFVNNVGDYLAAADLFVLPSLWEGLGTSTLDGMAAGLPCVVSAVDGLPEIVEQGKTGILVPPADPSALAEALGRMLDNPDEAREMAEAGQAFSANFTPARMADQYHALYQQILAES